MQRPYFCISVPFFIILFILWFNTSFTGYQSQLGIICGGKIKEISNFFCKIVYDISQTFSYLVSIKFCYHEYIYLSFVGKHGFALDLVTHFFCSKTYFNWNLWGIYLPKYKKAVHLQNVFSKTVFIIKSFSKCSKHFVNTFW